VLLSRMQRNGRIACIRHCQSTHAQAACPEEAAASSLHVERSAFPNAKLSASGPPPEPPMALNGQKVKLEVPELAPGQPKSGQTLPFSAPDPQISLVLKADLGAQQLTVLERDTVVRVWPISSGIDGYPTPIGTFQPKSANRMWYSHQYNWTPMPYAIFFVRGVAFHGTNVTSRLGKSASHGCIRLATSHAAQLFDLVHKHGFATTQIIVFGTARHDPSPVANRAPTTKAEPAASNGLPWWAKTLFD
jgi:lipoprotein-anchoring transpeptidase ErfK/SrfK